MAAFSFTPDSRSRGGGSSDAPPRPRERDFGFLRRLDAAWQRAELEAFCSSAAHDLRTSLRAITGFADVLLDPRAQIPPADAQRFVRMIRQGSGQMSELIHDLLAFSRLGPQELLRHGGKIWAESVPDQGATFYFTLCA